MNLRRPTRGTLVLATIATVTTATFAGAAAATASAAPAAGVSSVSLTGNQLRMTLRVIDSHSAAAGAMTPTAVVLNHSAIVSERADLTFTGKTTGGNMTAGYLVGCQVNLSNGINVGISPNVGLSGSYTPGVPSDDYAGPSVGLGGSISMSLVPGQVTTATIINTSLGSGISSPYQVAHNGTALNLSQCGGRASAVPFVTATLNSNSGTLQTTAYGTQFDF
ncbi:MspA family porin [Jongsikchunia kroppenstedtii]|uniref:MspA family porin n=1 Tax=Jongsikchunia kroppenstedtii TaxID=1121721 RepID=UPI000373BD33|nr:MspA family porin [Jongsikchunia kroppenstedtii]